MFDLGLLKVLFFLFLYRDIVACLICFLLAVETNCLDHVGLSVCLRFSCGNLNFDKVFIYCGKRDCKQRSQEIDLASVVSSLGFFHKRGTHFWCKNLGNILSFIFFVRN